MLCQYCGTEADDLDEWAPYATICPDCQDKIDGGELSATGIVEVP